MFEPHPAGHAHMRYSAPLTAALASICPERRFTLLVSPEGAPPHTTIFGVEIEGAIRTPRTLNSYTSPVAGVLDRLAHWGRADRQIGRWVSAHPDIRLVHYQDFYGLATLAGITALRRMGVRALLTVHNVRPHDIPRWQPVLAKDLIDRIVLQHFDGLVVHSESLRASLREFLGTVIPRIYVVPHGVGEMLRPGPLTPLEQRMARRKLLFIGSPRPNKGLPLLLEALRELPEFSLTLSGLHGGDTGYGDYITDRIARARQRGCRIQVRTGYVPDDELDSLLRTHSAVMLPYRSDFYAQSGVLSQAIAYGVPVVATDVGAVGETVRHFGLGCVAPPGIPESLADGVRRLYDFRPQELAGRLRTAAKALAWNAVAFQLSKVYDDICPTGSTAA